MPSRIATIAPEVPNVSAQVSPGLTQLMMIAEQLATIGPDFAPVRTKFPGGGSFATIFAILTYVRTQFTPILTNLTIIATNLPAISANFSAVCTQLATFRRGKPAAIGFLSHCQSRQAHK